MLVHEFDQGLLHGIRQSSGLSRGLSLNYGLETFGLGKIVSTHTPRNSQRSRASGFTAFNAAYSCSIKLLPSVERMTQEPLTNSVSVSLPPGTSETDPSEVPGDSDTRGEQRFTMVAELLTICC